MQTFAIVDGDLVLAAGNYLTLTGANKVKQDLYLALHERYRSDPYHPNWGTVLHRFIGAPMTPAVEQGAYNEVIRVVGNYMAVQADMINAHTVAGTRSVLNTSDVVNEITSAQAHAVGTDLLVNVSLSTMAGSQITIQRTVG